MSAKTIKMLSDDVTSDVHDYLQQWIQQDAWCDLSVMLDRGDTEMAAHHMEGTGAIDPDHCYPQFREIETAVLALSKKFRNLSQADQTARYADVFKECFIVDCHDCNLVSFADCGNEEIYPELKTKCWGCQSENIETRRGLK